MARNELIVFNGIDYIVKYWFKLLNEANYLFYLLY